MTEVTGANDCNICSDCAAARHGRYELVTDVEGYGRNALYELCEDQEIVDTVDGFVDWDSFGRHMLEADGLVFTEHGYVRLSDPEQPDMEQTMSCG